MSNIANNELKVYYDDKTTKWLEKHNKFLHDYEEDLWKKIKMLTGESWQSQAEIFREDIVRNQIIKLISKFMDMSIPVGIEVVDFDKEKS